jgi:hypothetical protein
VKLAKYGIGVVYGDMDCDSNASLLYYVNCPKVTAGLVSIRPLLPAHKKEIIKMVHMTRKCLQLSGAPSIIARDHTSSLSEILLRRLKRLLNLTPPPLPLL